MSEQQPKRRSIKNKVVLLVTGQLLLAMLAVIFLVLSLVNELMHEQTEAVFVNKAYALNEKLEQRIRYLVDNTQLLTSNELMVNALTDSDGRQNYLPPLVQNFMRGKGVLSLNVVDFDGRPIFQSRREIPKYNESSRLRTALALGQTNLFIDSESRQLVVISPIEYYSTTQGAVIVEFDLQSIVAGQVQDNTTSYVRLTQSGQTIFSHNYNANEAYRSFKNLIQSDMPMFAQLGLNLEIGLPQREFNAPIKDALFALLSLGAVVLLLSILTATWTASVITKPVIKLYQRVKEPDQADSENCYPLGSDDELEDLAKAFDERAMALQYQAEHDDLTGLPNRILFIDRLQQAIRLAERNDDKLAILFVDLDRFKEVNDSLGHDLGDKLLKQVSLNMKHTIRSSDSIARLGGDEFSILLNRVNTEGAVIDALRKIMKQFQIPYMLDNHQLYITCSIGIAIYPDNGRSPEELLKNADAAMYRAKDEGRNTYEFYTHDLTEKAYQRVVLESKLRHAIKYNEFEPYYQPQLNMRTGQLIGMEALIRWHQPDEGMIPPDHFIPLAEETGMIVEIDRCMMRAAMMQFAQWKKAGFEPGCLSMNLSMVQLNTHDFIDTFSQMMEETGLSSEDVMLEVTETQAMKSPERTIVMLEQLNKNGIKLAIDDFGTGFSSLAYLKRFSIDRIKIDKSFIMGIPEDQDDISLTLAIIALGRSLNKRLIAEGVETQEQSEFLLANGCDHAQGYLYYKPMPASEIEDKVLLSLTQHSG